MKVQMIKLPGGVLCPASDIEESRMARFKNDGVYEIEIVQTRNPKFHRKVMAFFNYCFEYWSPEEIKNLSSADKKKQFDVFRNHLTVLAGYYTSFYGIGQRVRIEAESLAYGNMDDEEFSIFYNSLINAAMKHIFKDCKDETIYNQLISFF